MKIVCCAVSGGLALSEAVYIMQQIGSTGWLMIQCFFSSTTTKTIFVDENKLIFVTKTTTTTTTMKIR